MRHALKWLVVCLLALPAAAQEQPAAPPATEQPAAAPEADKPADAEKPADAVADQPAEEPLKPVATTDAQNSICLLLESAARANGLPVEFFARVIWQESRFRPNAVGPMTRSGRRAQGIAQFMPGTAAERNLLNPFDPIQALPKSAEFLRDLRREFGNLGLAAAAYNAGPRRVREWLAGTGYMPSETRHYVHAITGATVEQWAKGSDKGDASDKRQQGGSDCGMLMARLKREPNPFVDALERRIETGSGQPWSVILTAGFSRQRILGTYAALEQRHAGILTGHDAFITQMQLRSRGPRPFYQVRIGASDRTAANDICNRIRRDRGACVILRNPQSRG
jgi:hypothetical protein